MLCIGLMSGTSLDGVDAALARFDANGHPQALGLHSVAMPAALRATVSGLQHGGGFDELAIAADAATAIADLYALAVDGLLAQTHTAREAVAALGAHGQTVRHQPQRGWTIQLLDGARLAERTGIDTVCDLRSADVAAGGQGAPLVPAFHAEVFADRTRRRAVVNIGGIANVSLLAPGQAVSGHDTGPGNTLLDAWCAQQLGRPFDADGAWAASAQPDARLLSVLLADPYFERAPPKSTGQDRFNTEWLQRALQVRGAEPTPAVVQSTLLQCVVESIAQACRSGRAEEVFLCGGGRRNVELTRRLAVALAPVPVEGTEALGFDPQAVEALAFAWLAWRRLKGLAGNLPSVTGAQGLRRLGAWYPGRRVD
jgi:anhydro-N-acetylmuramic acid kinase